MTSSTSSSSSGGAAAALLLAACLAALPARAAEAEGEAQRPRLRVLVLPPDNLATTVLPSKEITARIELLVAMAGAEVVGGERLDDYLAKYRIRYTGGVDQTAAKAAREDLGADAFLVTTLQTYTVAPPRFALTMRLVAARDGLEVLWMDAYTRAGDERPGLFNLGIVSDPAVLVSDAFGSLGRSLEAWLSGTGPAAFPCDAGGWFRPRISYRARPDQRDRTRIAVLPFVNETNRRGAGEIVALEFSRQVAADGDLTLLEPGAVRDELLRRRIVMEDGVSVDQARMVSTTLDADLVLAGYVFDYEDAGLVPVANFTVLVIDRQTGRIVWESTSYNKGTDSETVFGLRTVGTAPRLTCRMIRNVLDAMAGRASLPGP